MQDMNKKEEYEQKLASILTEMVQVLDLVLAASKRESLSYGKTKRNDELFEVATADAEKCLIRMNELSEQLDLVTKEISESGIEFQTIEPEKRDLLLHLNQEIAEKTMIITTIDEMNKQKFDDYMAGQRKEIKTYKARRKSAATYYNTMTKQVNDSSYLYDRVR